MGLMIDSSNYPWNTAPKPDSSNVIGRASFTEQLQTIIMLM